MSQRTIYKHLDKAKLILRDLEKPFDTSVTIDVTQYNKMNKEQRRAYRRFCVQYNIELPTK